MLAMEDELDAILVNFDIQIEPDDFNFAFLEFQSITRYRL
jgi:hypothetical protein